MLAPRLALLRSTLHTTLSQIMLILQVVNCMYAHTSAVLFSVGSAGRWATRNHGVSHTVDAEYVALSNMRRFNAVLHPLDVATVGMLMLLPTNLVHIMLSIKR